VALRKKTVLGIGLVLAGIGFYLLPLGMDIAFALATQVMNGSFWLGDLLLYAITVSMIAVGTVMIAKPSWFSKPRNVAIAVLAIVVVTFLTWWFGTGQRL